jgi:hypothetical protein
MNLNIIGNGFDLFHGLPSSYYYFGCYLIENEDEFYNYIGENYDFIFRNVSSTYPDLEYDYVVEEMFWKDFESRLGSINENFVVEKYSDDLGLENDDPIELEMEEDLVAERIKAIFGQWVKNTLDKDINYELIKKYKGKIPRFNYGKNNRFLVFNYTHTLQEIYGISDCNIYYVHGECQGTEDDGLIVGHGNNERIEEIKEKIKKLESIYDYTQKSKNKIDEHKCLVRYIEKLKKDVNFHMIGCKGFYKTFVTEPKKIKVYGMSVGDVDLPYLLQIRNTCPNASWSFSYYSDKERMFMKKIARDELKLDNKKFDTFFYNNPYSSEIMKRLVNLHNIIEYQKV